MATDDGAYGCRLIADADELPRRSFGDAIDIYGFDFGDGRVHTVADHWGRDTEAPVTEAGQWLRETTCRWFGAGIWNIILTPSSDATHEDHFLRGADSGR